MSRFYWFAALWLGGVVVTVAAAEVLRIVLGMVLQP